MFDALDRRDNQMIASILKLQFQKIDELVRLPNLDDSVYRAYIGKRAARFLLQNRESLHNRDVVLKMREGRNGKPSKMCSDFAPAEINHTQVAISTRRIPEHPYDFVRNYPYQHLISTYRMQDTWDKFELRRMGQEMYERLEKSGFIIVARDETVKLSFTKPMTFSSNIMEKLGDDICSFRELVKLLYPDDENGNGPAPNLNRLKQNLSFLTNFHQIQHFIDPITALTVISREEHHEDSNDSTAITADHFFDLTCYMEPRLLYRFGGLGTAP